MSMRRVATVVACGLLLAACAPADPAHVRQAPVPSPGVFQADDVVDLTLYFRSGEGSSAHLEPVTREVDVDEDLPARALELLLAGPLAGEDGLEAPLPAETRLRGLRVEGGVAHVELAAGAGAPQVADEVALALGALANTLTEFPSIDMVELDPSGWDAPRPLVRDESLIGPSKDGEGLVDLARFAAAPQSIGAADAGPVEIAAVWVRDRLTHVRVAVELASAEDADGAVQVPGTFTSVSDDELSLLISGVTAYSAAFGQGRALELSSKDFEELRVEHDGAKAVLRLGVQDASARPFRLHTLSSPTRVILDVKK